MQTLREYAEIKSQEVIIKKGKEQWSLKDSTLADVIRLANNLTNEMKALEPSLKEYKTHIAKVAKDYIDASGTVTFIVDGIQCKITFGYECVIPEENVEEVKRILGDRFEDLVRTKIKHEGTMKLIDMAADGDRGQAIAKCLVIKEKTPSIRFEAAA